MVFSKKMTMKKGPHFSSKKSTKKWFYQLPLDVMYAKNRKNHFFVFFGIHYRHYVQPKGHNTRDECHLCISVGSHSTFLTFLTPDSDFSKKNDSWLWLHFRGRNNKWKIYYWNTVILRRLTRGHPQLSHNRTPKSISIFRQHSENQGSAHFSEL